ncbi:MAG: acetylornithine/succinylornithine family transaminase [Coriobacteriales bacterium]|jgi:acetylornithine aminotransferase|nr:acetylornithine/succinylornithine family transaminase [Coriobacteriales bacterium]
MALATEQELDSQYIMQTFGRKPVEFVRGEGMRLYDDTGKEYLDFLAGIGCVALGHSHPAVVAAMREQTEKLIQASNYYYIAGRGELAEKLDALLNMYLDESAIGQGKGRPETWRTFFANTGTEAVEGAIKIARKYGRERLDGAHTIVTLERSFHGRTMGALAATGQPVKQEAFAPMPDGFAHVAFDDAGALVHELDERAHGDICAVLLECIQGEGGVWPCSEEYIKAVREETESRGILLMVDEVQTGMFRTGKPFAFQQYGILPDVVCMAKGLGGGMPIGAVCARGEYGQLLQPGEHGTTFGGNALAVAAANAVIDTLNGMDAGEHVTQTGEYLRERLSKIPAICDVRGLGLMAGADIRTDVAPDVVASALREGLVINSTGPHTLRFLPPLICTKGDIDSMIVILENVLEGYHD